MAMEHGSEINRILTFLSEKKNLPAVIHCAAGKDRTGWVSFLLQSIAGVPIKDIYEDYLFSNLFMFNNPVMQGQGKKFALLKIFNFDPNKFKPMQEARLEYLKAAADVILSKYESVEKYLIDFCMISDNTITNIRNILFECEP